MPMGPLSVRCSVGDHPAVPPPYDLGALAPFISEASMKAHEEHYLRSLRVLNELLDGDDALKRLPLEDLVKSSYNNGNPLPSFNWASEVWNHQLFWTSLAPPSAEGEAQRPSGELLELLERDLGGAEGFRREFRRAALSTFGSGWVWLSANVETLVPEEWMRDLAAHNPYRLTVAHLTVEKTCNALNPHIFDRIPLLALDMWEHAYIADYQMDRERYVDAFLDKLISWDTVVARMESAKAYVNFHEMPTPKDSLFRPGYIGDFRLEDAPITQEKAEAALAASSFGKKGSEEKKD